MPAKPENITDSPGLVIESRQELPVSTFATGWISKTVFCGLLLVIIFTAIPYGAADPWWQALFRGGVFLLGTLWVIGEGPSGTLFAGPQFLAIPAILFAVYAFVQSGFWSFAPYETRLVAAQLAALTLFGVLLFRYVQNEERLRGLVITVITVGFASALFGLARKAGQHGDTGFIFPALTLDQGFAQFLNKNHFSFLVEMSLGLLMGIAASRGSSREHRLAYFFFCLPMWAAIILSNSRGGILAIACQVIFLVVTFGAIHSGEKPPQDTSRKSLSELIKHSLVMKAALVVVLLFGIGVGTIWIGGDPLAGRLVNVNEELSGSQSDETHSFRFEIWKSTVRMFRAHPIVGTGYGAYFESITKYHPGTGALIPHQAHNDYLELLASGGLIGVLLFFAFCVVLIRQVRPRLRKGTSFERSACLGSLVGLFGVAVHSVVDFGLHITVIAVVFVSLVVIATVSYESRAVLKGIVLKP